MAAQYPRTLGTSEERPTVQRSGHLNGPLVNLSMAINLNPPSFHHDVARSYEEAEACIRKAIGSISESVRMYGVQSQGL